MVPATPLPLQPPPAIRYDLPEASHVRLMIYDLAGREVSSWDLQQQSGYKQIDWNGKDQKGVLVPAGVYIYRLTAKSVDSNQRFSATRKMLFLK